MARSINNGVYYAVLAFAVVGGFLAHEAAHWGAGEALGYEMTMSLNRAAASPGAEVSACHARLIDAAGPVFTIATALVAAGFVFLRNAVLAYPFIFAAFLMRLTATAVSAVNANDEMRISAALGLGDWTLPAVVTLALLALTAAASLRLGVGWRTNVLSYLVGNALIAAVVLGDQAMAGGFRG